MSGPDYRQSEAIERSRTDYRQSDVAIIESGSQAWNVLSATLNDPHVYRVSMQVRATPNGVFVAIKANESVWTPNMDGTTS